MPRKPARKSKRLSSKRKKGFSWKNLTKSKKTERKIKRVLAGSFIVLVALVVLGGYSLYRSLNVMSVSADSVVSDDLSSANHLSLALISADSFENDPIKVSEVSFVLLDKVDGKVLVSEVSGDELVEVPGKFGEEPYRNIVSLGMLESGDIDDGAKLLKTTLQREFAFKIDRYLLVQDDFYGVLKGYLMAGHGSGLSLEVIKKLTNEVHTNATLSELHSIYSQIDQLSPNDFIYKSELEDEDFMNFTFDSEIAVEKSSIAVLNGSGIPGAAGFFARVIKNCGGRTIAVDNAAGIYQKSVLIVDSIDSPAVKELSKFYEIENIVLKKDTEISEDVITRSDVTLIVGLDMEKVL